MTSLCCSASSFDLTPEPTQPRSVYYNFVESCNNSSFSSVTFTPASNEPNTAYSIRVEERTNPNRTADVIDVLWRPPQGAFAGGFLRQSPDKNGYTVLFSSEDATQFSTSIVIISPFLSNTVPAVRRIWNFAILDEFTFGRACVDVVTLGGSNPLPTEPIPIGCPSIEGNVSGTADGLNICQMTFTVTIPRGPCQDCPNMHIDCAITERMFQYRLYYPDVVSVLKGQGCTLVQKVTSLQRAHYNISLKNVATYSALRLILAKLMFGNFHIRYLRQSYYLKLIEALARSQFCRFIARLQTGQYQNYERIFLC